MRLEIKDTLTSTALSRDLYVFEYVSDLGFRLVEFARQTRASKRHKWTGPHWAYMQTRYVPGGRLNKPERIPLHVIDDARKIVITQINNAPIFIGYFNDDDRYLLPPW